MFVPPSEDRVMAGQTTGDGTLPDPGEGCFERRFQADPLAVREALRAAVARFARRLGPEDAGTLELTLAEVLNNIVEHAYDDVGAGQIDLLLRDAGDRLHCRIEDGGRPMPSFALEGRAMPATAVETADLAEGGWGWALVRDLTEGLCYVRDGTLNRLSFDLRLARR